jgi:hypothetical protein
MSGHTIRIFSDSRRAVPSGPGDLHDETGHHRYYGSSALNGGEQIAESRRGKRPRTLNVCGF